MSTALYGAVYNVTGEPQTTATITFNTVRGVPSAHPMISDEDWAIRNARTQLRRAGGQGGAAFGVLVFAHRVRRDHQPQIAGIASAKGAEGETLMFLRESEVVKRLLATPAGDHLGRVAVWRTVQKGLIESLRPGLPGPGAHPADVYAPQVGPVHWTMGLAEAENVIAGEAFEHLVMFAADGRQLGRFGPHTTLRLAEEGVRKGQIANFDDAVKLVQRACAIDWKLNTMATHATITHNHPTGMWALSDADLYVAVAFKTKEMRVVTPSGAGMMIRRQGAAWPSEDRMRGAYTSSVLNARVGMDSYIDAGHAYSEAAWAAMLGESLIAAMNTLKGVRSERWGPR